MPPARMFILLIYFIWLKGLSSEPVKKPPSRRLLPGASPLKAKTQQQKLLDLQTRRRTTVTPVHNPRFVNHFKTDDMNDEYYDYDFHGENPYFPDFDHHVEGHGESWIHPQDFHHMEEFPDYDYGIDLEHNDVEEEYDFPDRKRASQKAIETQAGKSIGQSELARLERKAKRPWKKKKKNKEEFKNKDEMLDEKPGSKKTNFSKSGNLAEPIAKKKYQFPKKKFSKKPADWQKKHGSWKERLKFGSQKYKKNRPKEGKHMSYNEKKLFNKPGKPSKFKGYESMDKKDDNNRLFKKSINNSSSEGITYFPAETAVPKLPELPTARSMTVKRSDEVKRQALEENRERIVEPPPDLKPGAFKAQMFHERVVRNGSLGHEDNVLYAKEKLPVEKRRVIANNPARRRRKHIEAKFPVKQYFPINSRRLFKKDVNNSTPQYIPTTTTSIIDETTIMGAPTILMDTEPPITGEIEPPTTVMVKKRTDNKRFVGPRYASHTRVFKEPISKVTSQELENFYGQKGMHLVKLIYRIKEQELESIFDTLNISTSTEISASLTTPTLEDVVKMQSSVIQQLVKAIHEKLSLKKDLVRHLPSQKYDRNTPTATKDRKNIAPDSEFDPKRLSGIEKRFKIPGLESIGVPGLPGINLQTALQTLYQIHKSKNNQRSFSDMKIPATASSKPLTEILIRNLLKNPAYLQQLLSRNSNKSEETATVGFLTPAVLQLLATSVLKTADKVDRNEVLDKGTEDKASFKESQSLDGKFSKIFGDKSNATPPVNSEKASPFGKDLVTTEKCAPTEDDKKANPERLKQILLQLLKNPTLVRRSNINRRKVRDSILKSKQMIGRSLRLMSAETDLNATTSVSASEVSKERADSAASDRVINIRDTATEDPDEEDGDEGVESTTNSYILTKPSVASTPETEDDAEDVDGETGTEERDDPVESEILTENDTTLPTEHS